MLLLRNVNCASIVQSNSLNFSMIFFIIIQQVNYLMTTKNTKNTKAHKNIIYIVCSNRHSLVLVVPNHQCCHLRTLKVY